VIFKNKKMKDFNLRQYLAENKLDKEANIDEGIFDIERDREGADFFELIDPNRGVLVTGTKQDIMEYLWENTELEIKQIK
tara:strand:+ start:819 stop:1058 length:240 start_codon:yes stop_codon:yes gene_type:complete